MTSLFDNSDIWQSDPMKGFGAFVLSDEFLELGRRKPVMAGEGGVERPRPIRSSSVRIYIFMFGNFIRWLEQRHRSLTDVASEDIQLFLDAAEEVANIHGEREKKRRSTIRVRYLRLFERVFTHLKVVPNPAQHAAFDIYNNAASGKDVPMVSLTESQQQDFMQALPKRVAVNPYDDETAGWKQRRDRAMQAMMLGAGLKVSEVIGIYTENVGQKDSTGSIPITISPGSAGGVVRWHRTQLRPFAVLEVMQWLRERKSLKIPGPLLFPATLQGKSLNKATVYRQTKATFERAGITVSRQGGRTLRNSFAHRELEAGESVELVGEFLGHRLRKSTETYVPKKSKKSPECDTVPQVIMQVSC